MLSTKNEKDITDERKHKRVILHLPLKAILRKPSLQKSEEIAEVLVENISVKGLKFISPLHLETDVLYTLETNLCGKTITLSGTIVWSENVGFDIYKYGVQFQLSEKDQKLLNSLLKTLKHLVTQSPKSVEGWFIDTNAFSFLKRQYKNKNKQ
nr:PilZ domain-containing protein [Salirhabdus salicampi]